ncbi:hypothetical protein [Modestobacter sp. Leaf380]|uniref:hypothetical protein n=1 Tax=Modestobacter sp. Leaf380 TaxID=1736356 RepID=UPI0006F268B0|nr:hypothetical protein [Modestobacter sp. Leaf380]KQS68813.1 hypothetical protein ASG41_07865 [Modestobacter sp. Leaf380]
MPWKTAAPRRPRSVGVVLLTCVLLLCTGGASAGSAGDPAVTSAPGVSTDVLPGGTDPGGRSSTDDPAEEPTGATGRLPGADPASTGDPTTATAPLPSGTIPTTTPVAPAGGRTPTPDPAAVGSWATPAGDRAPGSVDGTLPDGAPTEGAVWCQVVPVTFSGVRADGSVPVGAATMTATPSVTVAGRSVDWSVVSSGRVVGSGTSTLGPTGGFSTPVTLPSGPATVTTALRFSADSTSTCPPSVVTVSVSSPLTWASGGSGPTAADGSFAAWRGTPTQIAGTWCDNNQAMLGLWQLRPGFELGAWQGDLDIAVGAIGPGESWAAAATGAYDGRWRQSLTELRRLWSGRPGQLYIRFAHEFNGNWYDWSVTGASVADFRASWIRYRALQQEVFPESDLVFSPNSETNYWSDLDWRTAFPGRQYVDVMAVDYYNMWPYTGTAAQFDAASLAYDRWGAPRGLKRHQEFAASVGLPFAVAEWGNNAEFGDSPAYIEGMNAFFRAHAGRGPGQLVYDIYFNVLWDGNPFALYPSTNAPGAAEAYRRVF